MASRDCPSQCKRDSFTASKWAHSDMRALRNWGSLGLWRRPGSWRGLVSGLTTYYKPGLRSRIGSLGSLRRRRDGSRYRAGRHLHGDRGPRACGGWEGLCGGRSAHKLCKRKVGFQSFIKPDLPPRGNARWGRRTCGRGDRSVRRGTWSRGGWECCDRFWALWRLRHQSISGPRVLVILP